MSTVVLFIVVVLFLLACMVIGFISKLFHVRLREANTTIAVPEQIPQKLRAAFHEYAEQCLPAEFEFSHFMWQETMELGIDTPDWIAVYFHQREKSFVEVGVNTEIIPAKPFKALFVTLYDKRRVMTADHMEGLINHEGGNCELHKSRKPTVADQWAQHLYQVQQFEAQSPNDEHRVVLELISYTKRRHSDYRAYLADIKQNKFLLEKPDGLKVSFKALKGVLFAKNPDTVELENAKDDAQKAVNLATKAISDESYALVESIVFNRRRQLEKNTRISPQFKIAAFFLSGIACAIFIGLFFSWDILLVLFPVLFLHELGHLAAMTAFGYKRKYMLFMPLGAFVMGEKDHAPTWQKMVVFLAGPIPGIVLAFGLLSFLPHINELTHSFIVMLLIINCFNLIPVMPLDGGQLVNLAISHRFPMLQFVLHILSLLVALGIAVLLGDSVLYIIAIWLALAVPDSFQKVGMFRYMKLHIDDNATTDTLVEKLFISYRNKKSKFSTRYEQIKHIVSCSKTERSATLSTAMFVMYVVAFLGPPVYLASNTGDSFNRLLTAGIADQQYIGDHDLHSSEEHTNQTPLSAVERRNRILASDSSNDEKIDELIIATYAHDLPEADRSIDYLEQDSLDARKYAHIKAGLEYSIKQPVSN